ATSSTSAKFTALTAGTSYNVTVTATDAAGSLPVSASGTPWGRAPVVYCGSSTKGFQFPTPAGTCNGPNNNIPVDPPPAFTWATTQPPQGSMPLYRQYGTTTPNNASSGTEYYYTNSQNKNNPGLPYLTPGDAGGTVTWVFPTQQAGGPGSKHVCEALVNHTWMGQQTSYYNLFDYGTQPSGCILDFWT
ncbi:MAG: hypothetical protein M3Y91_18090, partial [Actinomycetota bacterium]|nr:hypothetical protein [Actinomycetota bacterium]